VVEQVRSWLAAVLDELGPREVMAPLGAGHHVDHRITHQVAVDLVAERPGMQITFFEERPAAFVEQAVWLRLTQVGRAACSADVGNLPLAFRSQRFFQSFFGASATRQQIRPADHAPIVVHLLEAFARGLQEPAAAARSSRSSWSLDILTEWLPALDALAAESRGFVGSPLHIQWATLEYARRLGFPGHYVERAWHL
jgi:LmbE family N-acetylglucosaminyl deacetylase